MTTATGVLIAGLIASLLTASLMTIMQLSGGMIFLVAAPSFALVLWAIRNSAPQWQERPLDVGERALLLFAVVIGVLRLAPYAYQYISGVLVAPVTWDDNWHFQELASLVNADRFPPRANFAPEAYFHYYYVPWIPAAAISSMIAAIAGTPMIKLGLGIGALALAVGVAWGLIVGIRHICAGRARALALGALVIAGAAIDGLFAIWAFTASGTPVHVEWWQVVVGIPNEFSALSTSLIWVPQHMISGIAVLLALVVATEPRTLALRQEVRAYVLAGLLLATSAYSSIFAFAGGVIALSPLLWALLRTRDLARIGALGGSFIVAALPLAYIYLGSDAKGGFVVGRPYTDWAGPSGNFPLGVAGVLVALLLMMLEVGWLFIVGRAYDRGGQQTPQLRSIAIASMLVLVSTAMIGFSGANNWTLRATIVPVILLACYAGVGVAQLADASPNVAAPSLFNFGLLMRLGTVALAFAAIAHVNEVVVLARAGMRSPAFAEETSICKAAILATNQAPTSREPLPGLAACHDTYSPYHIERPFRKSVLTAQDRELMGHGYGFLRPTAGNVAPK